MIFLNFLISLLIFLVSIISLNVSFDNIANQKPVFSSEAINPTYETAHINDANNASCFLGYGSDLYVVVDLSKMYEVRRIKFVALLKYITDLNELEASISNVWRTCYTELRHTTPSCDFIIENSHDNTVIIWNITTPSKCVGRYLILRSKSRHVKYWLNLCDLQIEGVVSSSTTQNETEGNGDENSIFNRCYITDTNENIALNKEVTSKISRNLNNLVNGKLNINNVNIWRDCYWNNDPLTSSIVIDLNGVFEISLVRIWNSFDTRFGRSKTINIGISTQFRPPYWTHDRDKYVIWIGRELSNKDQLTEATSKSLVGQYIYIEKLTDVFDYMIVCKIEIFGNLKMDEVPKSLQKIHSEPLIDLTKEDFPLMTKLLNGVQFTYSNIYSNFIKFFDSNCEGILWDSSYKWPYAVACTFGKGHAVIFGKSSYFDSFIPTYFHNLFYENLIKWLSPNKGLNSTVLLSSKSWFNQYKFGDVIHIDINHKMDETQLLGELKSGHIGIVLDVTDWHWKQFKVHDNYEIILKVLGIEFVNHYTLKPSGQIVLTGEEYKYARLSLIKQVEFMRDSMTYFLDNGLLIVHDIETSNPIEPYQTKLSFLLNDILDKYRSYLSYSCPASYTRLKKGDNEKMVILLNRIFLYQGLSKYQKTAPCFDVFPGSILNYKSTSQLKTATLSVKNVFSEEINPIGLYVPAGVMVNYTVKNIKGNWKFRIGSQTDKFGYWPNLDWYIWERYPIVTVEIDIKEVNKGSFYSPFGGLLSLIKTADSEKIDSSVEVEISGIVESKMFNKQDEKYEAIWNKKLDVIPPWVILAGQYFHMVVPYSDMESFTKEQINDLVDMWDKIISLMHVMAGSKPEEVPTVQFVVDQISISSSHSGNPIVISTNQLSQLIHQSSISKTTVSSKSPIFLLTNTIIQFWNLFPQPQHCFNNILIDFALTFSNKDPFYTKSSVNGENVYDLVNIHFPKNGSDPSVKFGDVSSNLGYILFGDLIDNFNWGLFQNIFRDFTKNITLKSEDSEQTKWEFLLERLSHHSQMNLSPIFDFWNISVSKSLQTHLATKYPCFFPNGFYKQLSPSRHNIISLKYGSNCHTVPLTKLNPAIPNLLVRKITKKVDVMIH